MKDNTKKNKHGLSRYIPAEIRRQIRKDAGFGCVICGCVLVDYEHIEPEFSFAKEHDPSKMTLLCIDCHGRVTRKLISKKKVWEAKSNPRALQDGYVHDILFVDTDKMEIKFGDSTSKETKIVLSIHGKPLIWFESPTQVGEPSKLCAIFYDKNGRTISYVNRNQFIAFVDNQDVKSESTKLSILADDENCLTIDREGDSILEITCMKVGYLDTTVNINSDGSLTLNQGGSILVVGGFYAERVNCLIDIGSPPSITKYNKLWAAMRIAHDGISKTVWNSAAMDAGWELDGEIINRKYEVVGFCKGDSVFNIHDEFIGKKNGRHITCEDDSYESNEPIYISQKIITLKDLCSINGHDVSFRLFGYIA